MRHLSTREVEEGEFNFQAWKPEPLRKTLLPIPEHIQAPSSTLEEAHEAILDAMQEENIESDTEVETNLVKETTEKEDSKSPTHSGSEKIQYSESLPSDQDLGLTKEQSTISTKPPEPLPIVKEKVIVNTNLSKPGKYSLGSYQTLSQKLGLEDIALKLENSNSESVKILRKSLATHVGVEPRDVRVDRMLRIVLRLLPNGDEKDLSRSKLIDKINSSIPKYNEWMKLRLEARHSGAKGDFIQDTQSLGNALSRIPGPGFALPLIKDDKPLPSSQDIELLSKEVDILLRSMNLPSASGIVVEAV
jgi:hypothetical protein